MTRRWRISEIRYMQRHYKGGSRLLIARCLGRTPAAVASFAKSHGLTDNSRLFSPAERAYVQAHQQQPAQTIADALGRPLGTIYRLRARLGLTRKNTSFGPRFEAFLRQKNAAGYSDSEIATLWGAERHAVSRRRRLLGLPFEGHSQRMRNKVAAKTRAQCQAAGVKSLAEIRRLAFKQYAVRYGWPMDLLPRQVQMLNAMLQHGPMTRPQLAAAIGMPWKGVRKSLTGNVPKGTYLADLVERGLVVDLGRIVKGKGSGHSTHLYSVPLPVAMQRSAHVQEHAA